MLALADGLARFDAVVLAPAPFRVARATTVFLAGGLAAGDHAVTARATRGITGGTRRLGASARRLQGGQLHTYYLQVLIVLLAGVALLLVLR